MFRNRLFLAAASCLAASAAAAAPVIVGGDVEVPASSVVRPADAGIRAHTNILIFHPHDATGSRIAVLPPSPSGIRSDTTTPTGHYETPESLACVYGLSPHVVGCNTSYNPQPVHGGSRSLAIVDAFDYPNAVADLATFSSFFHLPAANLQVVYASGVKPRQDSTGGWESEEALDVQMAHAMAPNAKIYLVEAASDSLTDLLAAVDVASKLVTQNKNSGEVSMSWGTSEFSDEESLDTHFEVNGIVYFASTGDTPGTEFPSVSQHVIAAGGTTINRDGSGNYTGQATWNQAGGGMSAYVGPIGGQSKLSVPHYRRLVPDISFDANPASPVWFYDSVPSSGASGWQLAGGTSVASPALAGFINSTGKFYGSAWWQQNEMYGYLGNSSAFIDVTSGNCGPSGSYAAAKLYDLCTGIGAPVGTTGK
jgi:subtilase family serine protease